MPDELKARQSEILKRIDNPCYAAIERVGSRKCGEEIHCKEDGSIGKKISHLQKCTQECNLMIPYR
ncbi:MAG TPA: hypothetical protein PL048_13340 [Leptospiraceae bacterium]|nr:hypothetical protein [Leptospiraceae bacterium]HNF24253.1 hypothetical protein [Leptospiraceae bacterium]HNI95892.1 hypothetical protein [Leptospiraceae bacterium]